MDKYIDSFPRQLREALIIGKAVETIEDSVNFKNILICGMGGSGIGGMFIKEIVQRELSIPVCLNQSYDLPGFAGENSFVICSSYSGNTEETISNLNQAIEKKCRIICVTSGGEMQQIANSNHIPVVTIPGGMPPRSCLGYSLIAQLFIFSKAGLIHQEILESVEPAIQFLEDKQGQIKLRAIELIKKISGKLPLIYSSSDDFAMAVRWKQQINENSKLQCFANAIPEMNHNELVAFETQQNDCVILLRNTHDHPRVSKRFDLVKELISKNTGSVVELWSEGDAKMQRLLYFIHLGDWISFYLAADNHADPIEIQLLDELKKRLGSSAKSNG